MIFLDCGSEKEDALVEDQGMAKEWMEQARCSCNVSFLRRIHCWASGPIKCGENYHGWRLGSLGYQIRSVLSHVLHTGTLSDNDQ